MTRRIRDYTLASSIVIGAIAGIGSLTLRWSLGLEGSGDFHQSCRLARALVEGTNPYQHPLDEWYIPSPLPAGFLCVPAVNCIPGHVSGAIFFGASTALLAWGILRRQPPWRLLVLFSWPYVYAAMQYQWTPLVMSLAYIPLALPVMLMKPCPSKGGIIFTCIVLVVSLVVYPTWPWVWFKQAVSSGAYEGLVPLLYFPAGLALAVAPLFTFRWEGRVLSWMSVGPQRLFYDQLLLFALPRTKAGMFVLVATSWAGLVWYVRQGGWRWWRQGTFRRIFAQSPAVDFMSTGQVCAYTRGFLARAEASRARSSPARRAARRAKKPRVEAQTCAVNIRSTPRR